MRLRSVAVVAVGFLAVTLTGCGRGTDAAGGSTGPIRVVASTDVYGDIVRQIGGSHVSVTSIMDDPDVDPHGYESSVKNAATVARARLVVDNGLGYDSFMDKLTATARAGDQRVVTAAKVLGRSGSDTNPHLWYDVPRMPEVANAIAHALGQIQPNQRTEFNAGASRFAASLRPVQSVLHDIRERYAGTKVATTERVAGYLLRDTDLRLGIPASFARALEEGDDPSPGDTEAFRRAVSTRAVHVLILNKQVTDKQTDTLERQATSAGVPVVSVTETLPRHTTYQAWQLSQARALLSALGHPA